MQLQCRRTKILNNIENKGEFDGLSQITQMKNCAIRDAVAQWKMKWRKSRGAIEDLFYNQATKEPSEEVPASFLRCWVVKIPLVSFWAAL
jgi:hypothetical protein